MKSKTTVFILSIFFVLVLCGVVSAADNNTAMNTTHNGTVSGDLYVNATQPVGFSDQPGSGVTSREFNQTYTLPTNESAHGTDIQWAEIYVNIYSGSGSANWPVNATIKLDGDGDGIYETTLGSELLTSTRYTKDGSLIWINDHCTRVYSDYQLWYDVTGLITCNNPSIYVKTEQVGAETFDGRLKMIALLVAYNDGDNDKVDYWVNDGQDWISSGTSQTAFNTGNVLANASNATLNTVALSSKDGSYDFNGETHNGTDPVAPVNYFVTHMWNVTANVTRGNNSVLTYTAGSGSFKNVLATLTIREEYSVLPVANFTANTTSGAAPLTVQFTDNSTNVVEWAWDFDSDGITDSTEKNPIYTYINGGTYTVSLTVKGPGGTVTETKNNYIAVIPNNYMSYLGKSGNDVGYGIAVDNNGNIYITGSTSSTDFPTTSGAHQATNAGGNDVFIVKFNSSGALVYSTYLGGSGNDMGYAIAVDADGNIYITGYTVSTNFPTTSGANQTTYGGGSYDAFVAKFNSNGTLLYSTYLGGTNNDYGRDIAVDNTGNIYITGYTRSTNFPTSTGAYQTTLAGNYDAFLTKYNSSGNLMYSTYLGGSGSDSGYGNALDNAGNIYITGYTASTNFPTTSGVYQATNAGGNDAFVTKFSSDGSLVYSTYLGGSNSDAGNAIAVDNSGNAFITGQTKSTNLPMTVGAYLTTFVGSEYDAYVAKLNSDGTSLVYCTYLGGSASNSIETEKGIAVDNEGNAYVTGNTNSGDFPVTSGAYQPNNNGGFQGDVILTKINSNGTGLFYSTYLGGSGNDCGYAVALDSKGNAYMTGYTNSANFPVTIGAYQSTIASTSQEIFIAKLDLTPPVANFTVDVLSDYAPLTVQFTDQSTSKTNLTAWAWDFNNDGTVDSTEQNPTYTYTVPGTYTVKLTVTNVAANNSTTKTNYVTVVTPPTDNEAPTVIATPIAGNFTSAIQVVLSATDNYDINPKIYYTTDGTDPNTTSIRYTGPISITENTVLKFIAADRFGNVGTVQTESYLINDTEAPTVNISPVSGNYHESTQVVLSVTDNADPNPVIYYTTDGTNPTTSSTIYTGPITLPEYVTTVVKFIAVDKSGNISPVQNGTYTITDIEAPTANATQSGTTVTLSAADNMDPNPQIYYTTNGSEPTSSSTPYSAPFNIPQYASTLIKFIAVDVSGNTSPVQNRTYSTYTGDPWTGGRYNNGVDLETQYYAEGNIGLVISNGGTGYTWFAHNTPGTGTVTYTASDLGIPEGATLLAARLYQSWNWYGYPSYTLVFNGNNVNQAAHYVDGNDGQDVFDVTPFFNLGSDNTAVLTSTGGASYATILIVIYQYASEPFRQIWIDEGYDILYHSPATGYAMFRNVTNDKVAKAEITTITPSGGSEDTGSITVNGQSINLASIGGNDPTFNYYHILSALQNGTNEVGVAGSSYFSLATAILTVTMEPKPVANFAVNTTNGIVPMTVQFTDKSTNATGWSWDFDNDGTVDSNEQNPVYNYQIPGTYTVKLTVTGPGGEDVEEKLNYIMAVSLYDLAVTGDVDVIPTGKNTVFAKETNPVQCTVKNNGSNAANNIRVALYASDVSSTVPVATITIESLAAGASTSIEILDPTIRDLEGGTVTYTIKVDPENTIVENNETDNAKDSLVKSVKYNGYKGKSYWENGSNVTTQRTYDIYGNIVYSNGDSSYHGGGWNDYTVTWSGIQPTIPNTASIAEAWLYVAYTWDETGLVPNNLTLTFNGHVLNYVNWYVDQANFGTYANYKYGLLTYNVTEFYNKNGVNTLFLDRNGKSSIAMYPCNLMVIYEDANSTRKQIFINEEVDLLGFSQTSYGTTLDEATAYVPFTGLVIDTSKVKNATFYSSAGNAGPDEGNFIWNGSLITSNAWNGTSTGIFTLVKDVTSYLTRTGNVAGIQSTNSGGMAALQQILVVEYAPDLVVTNITVNKGSGDNWFANEPNNLTLNVTNQGGSASPASALNVDVNGTIYTVDVPALDAGSSATVTVTDSTSRTSGDAVPVSAATDPSNSIPETNETNNSYSVTFKVYNNGYKGKRYTNGTDLETNQTFEGNYDVIYSSGNSTYRSGGTGGSAWNNPYTVTWTSADLTIPEGATVAQVRLYQPYTWNTVGGVPDFVATFNGNIMTYLAHYNDTKGYGSSNYPSGLFVYDVTSFFQMTGNTLTLTKGINTTISLYGGYLVVVYQDANATYKKIYINDGTDLLCSYNPYSVNDTEATAYATYNNVNTSSMSGASVVVVMASADKTDQSKFLFNGNVYSGFWNDYTGNSKTQTGFSVYNVFGNMLNGSNLAGIQSYNNGTTGDNMVALSSILIVTYDIAAPTVNASLGSGLFNATQTVTLAALDDQDTNPTIYYTTDNTTPTTSSTVYTGPITVGSTTTLKFFAVDDTGNTSPVQTQVYTIDTILPVVSASPNGGIFNTTKTVTLQATDNLDTNPVIYYTTDGTTPTSISSVYTGPITVGSTTTIRFFAVDDAGNVASVQSTTYTIDTVAPEVNADLNNGTFEIVKSVNLTATDNLDTNPTIYYTTDGTTPTTSSTQYTGPITVDKAMKLMFFAVDDAGNTSPVQSRTYDVKSDVYVEVTASNNAPAVGDTVRYTFKLCNRGPGTATDVVFTYQIPERMEYAGVSKDSGSVSYDPTTRTITWTFSELVAGDPYLWLDLRVLSAGSYLIQPLVTISNYNPSLASSIGSLKVNAVVKATSVQAASTTVSNMEASTVPMQTTGMPLGALLVGLLCIVSGLGLHRRF